MDLRIGMYKIVVAILLLLPIAIVFYYFQTNIDQTTGFFPPCVFKSLTGLSCIFCGGQRALQDVLQGEILAAFRHNAFFLICIPYLLLVYVQFFVSNILKRNCNFKIASESKYLKIILIGAVIFTIIRNLPELNLIFSS